MRGILIVNAFLRTLKFQEIYELLQASAKSEGIELSLKTSGEILQTLDSDRAVAQNLQADFCLFWDKDIYLAQRLENTGIKLFNSAKAVENCDDKLRTAIALEKCGLPMPKTFFAPKTFDAVGYNDLSFLKNAEEKLGYPMIVKEAFGSFGQQVYLSKFRAETQKIVQSLGAKSFLLQEFIKESVGKDLRVNVVGDRAVCAMERCNDNDFRSNVTGGGKTRPHTLTKSETELAIAASQAVGADFSGVDLLFGENGMLVCEVNSNPHFKSTLDCTGVDLSAEIIRYIKERV